MTQATVQIEVMGATKPELDELQALLSKQDGVLEVRGKASDAGLRPGELHASIEHEVLKVVLPFLSVIGVELAKEAAKEAGKRAFTACLDWWRENRQEGESHDRIQFQLAEDGDLLISPRRPKP